MASSYRGLYRLGLKDEPTADQVVDPGGNTLPLGLHDYVTLSVRPDWRELPTEKNIRLFWV